MKGLPQGWVVPQRGLLQRCHLSPYLFILCVEGLSFLLTKVLLDGTIMGFAYSRRRLRLSHLFFAYDFLNFRHYGDHETGAHAIFGYRNACQVWKETIFWDLFQRVDGIKLHNVMILI